VILGTSQNFAKKIKNMLKILTHMSNTDHNKNLIDYKGSIITWHPLRRLQNHTV